MSAVVLDSCAFLAYLANEPEAAVVEALLRQADEGITSLAMCAVNLGEVYYRMYRRAGHDAAARAWALAASLGIEVVSADGSLALEAAELKAVTPVAYADCFAAALARRRGAKVATRDAEFAKFGDRVDVLWLAQ